jgi:hypothetical protein
MDLVGSILLVEVQVVRVLSLVMLSLLDALHFMVDTSLGGVTALSLRGATDHAFPFVVLVLLQKYGSGFPVVVPALIVVIGWCY